MLSTWIWTNRHVFVMQNPKRIVWGPNGLHCDDGPAVYYSPFFSLWAINGVTVDEQIVMRPETQSIDQIEQETNEDVRAIRIERLGWHRYIEHGAAEYLDGRRNDIEGTRESLYRTKYGKRLIATCPSGNQRIVALGVPDSVETCEQAQRWLAGERPFNVLGRT